MIIRRQKDWISKSAYDTLESIVFMFSSQKDRYLPSQEAIGYLFSVYFWLVSLLLSGLWLMKALESSRARKAMFSSPVSKSEVYTP